MSDRITALGFNTGFVQGDLDRFARSLDRIAGFGATACEVTSLGLDAVVDCRLVPDRVAQIRRMMEGVDLSYSMHAPIGINLMDQTHAEIMSRAALASLELAAAIGARVVVFHPGQVSPQSWIEREEGLLQFEIDQLGPLADRAAGLGVQIAYENISPSPRVIAGQETSYSLDPGQLAAQLTRLDHDAVMACLDVSHAQQGARLWGFDLLEACATLAPWIGHIHYSDSTGRPATMQLNHEIESQFFGVGDMHAPPGWGSIDFNALAHRLSARQGTRLIIEIRDNYHVHAAPTTLERAREFASLVNEGTAAHLDR